MTKADWLECSCPEVLLEFLADRASNQQFRKFANACCTEVRDLFPDEFFAQALDVNRRFANDQATRAELDFIECSLNQNPVTWAEGYDWCHAAQPDPEWYLIVAGEFAAFSVFFAVKDPRSPKAAEYAAFARATSEFAQLDSTKVAASLAENMARSAVLGPQCFDQYFRVGITQHDGSIHWFTDPEVKQENGYAVLAIVARVKARQCDLLRELVPYPDGARCHA